MAEYMRQYRSRRTQRVIAYLGGVCCDCDRRDELRPVRRAGIRADSIPRLIAKSRAWDRLLPELATCELRCPDHDPRRHVPGIWQHGTIYGYNTKRCRCDDCYAAKMVEYTRHGRAPAKRHYSWGTGDHGSVSRYRKGCRCRPCRDANRIRMVNYRAQKALRENA